MNVELNIAGTRVPVLGGAVIPLTMAISDLKDPFSRSGTYSKTVKLPASPEVDKLFDHIFEINSQIQNTTATNFNPDFNPNLKADVVCSVDTIEVFRGYARLRSIVRNKQSLARMHYNLELFGELGNIVIKLGESKLTDLSFSEYNHTYNRTNQKASWTPNYLQGYAYTMIDRGLNDTVNWRVEHFYPAIYARQYWDKIFAYVGCYYTGSFATSTLFTHLIHPFTGDSFKLSQAQAQSRLFEAQLSSGITVTGSSNFGTIAEPVVYGTEISDPDSQYNPANGYFTCVSPGFYEFVVEGNYYWEAVGGNVQNQSNNLAYLNVLVYHERGSVITLVSGAAVHNDFNNITSGNQSSTVNFTYTSLTQECYAGDRVWIKFLPVCSPVSGGANLRFHMESAGSSFYNTVQNPSIVEGGTVDMASAIPPDVRMVDYFLAIVKEHNLMVEPDKTMPNTYRIDTAKVFYASGTPKNWTQKLDVSKEWEQFPMGALDAREYIMKRQDGEDYFNKSYREQWGESYGTKTHTVTNDFVKDQNVYESLFTDSPLVGRNSDDRVYPAIYTLDSSNNPKPVGGGMRILYFGGEIATGYQWNYVTNSGTFAETTYPYAGHLDSVSSPTIDLCFDTPKMLFYNMSVYTDGNYWNLFHSQFIDEITNKNSKLVTAYFYLKPVDVLSLSFRNPIWIENSYYRLQKVIDYDPTKEQSTKCELIKIINGSEFSARTFGIANWLGSTAYVNINVQSRPKPKVVSGTSQLISGSTTISSERVGYTNFVSGATTVTINTSGLERGDRLRFKKVDGGTTTTLSPATGLIDGSSTLALNAQYMYRELEWDGVNFWLVN